MNILNGYKNPKFEIETGGEPSIISYELPLTNSGGLIETTELLSYSVTLHDWTNLQDCQGFHTRFTLHYNEYVTKDTLYKIKEILKAVEQGRRIWIIPRADIPFRKFEVHCINDEFELGLLKGGASAIGHRLPVLEFRTVYKQDSIWWTELTYYGSGYQSPTRGELEV